MGVSGVRLGAFLVSPHPSPDGSMRGSVGAETRASVLQDPELGSVGGPVAIGGRRRDLPWAAGAVHADAQSLGEGPPPPAASGPNPPALGLQGASTGLSTETRRTR